MAAFELKAGHEALELSHGLLLDFFYVGILLEVDRVFGVCLQHHLMYSFFDIAADFAHIELLIEVE